VGPDSEKVRELRVKYLEMVQAIVTQLSNHAATLKNSRTTLSIGVVVLVVVARYVYEWVV
jgi:hypothetical protein